MKIRILKSAREDLKEGYHFYELQQEGLGLRKTKSEFRLSLTVEKILLG